tara:strand:+ start:83 stop:601 length:519 start_codon:yes stop_codon:yes gene_type:complete
MNRSTRFFLFQSRNEYWIVDENTLQQVPKPREMIIKKTSVESIRDYVITLNRENLPIVDKCRDRTEWHTPEGRERIRQAKVGYRNPHSDGLTNEHRQKISETMTGTRRGEFNPMYGRKHTTESIQKIRAKAYERPKMRWCVEPSGKCHLIPISDELPEEWQWGRFYDKYRPT